MRINTTTIRLLTTAVFPMAFNSGGWKKDAEGKLVLDAEGNPIFINAGGVEQSVKGDTISGLQQEAKGHRIAKETAEGELAKFKTPDGKMLDPVIAIKAVDTVSKIDAKQLMDAGKVDELTNNIKAGFTAQLTEKDAALAKATETINAMKIDGVFKGSEFITNSVAMPRDFFEAAMRSHFKVEDDGKVAAYDRAGNRLMSKNAAGEYADTDEALELLVGMHPQKDTILKPVGSGGSGNQGDGGNRGGGRTMKRADFLALPANEQSAIATKGETQIVD